MPTLTKGGFTAAALAVCAGLLLTIPTPALSQAHTHWPDYGGGPDAAQYTALTQINRANVDHLQVAWTVPTGDGAAYNFEPIEAHGVLYLMTAGNSITAVEPATGKHIWTYTPDGPTKIITSRGLNYWESADGKDRRIIFARNQLLQELDARTGKPISSFGDHGTVNLLDGLGRNPATLTVVETRTPGRIFGDLIIEGSATNQGWGSAPGDIRAFNVRTGRLVWTFHTIPHPGEPGYNTWPKNAWKTVGGANSWGEISVDPKRGIVYIPTASPKFNFYGGDRTGADHFADSLVALNARTGKLLWSFQMVHHDVWDYDNTSAPKLLTVMHDGKREDVVAEAGKTGWVYVFNRVTGKPLWPIIERPEPKSDVPGEHTYPTQPIPTAPPPFARQRFTSADLNPYLPPAEAAKWKKEIDDSRNDGMFTPPALTNVMEMPGNAGGANFGASAADARHGIFIVVSMDFPTMLKLYKPATPRGGRAGARGVPGPAERQAGGVAKPRPAPRQSMDPKTGLTKYNMKGFGYMTTSLGVPPISPPWSTITAYDLNKGTILWKKPLGDLPALAAKGIHNTGSSQPYTGPVITASGLVFTATRDHDVRAWDEMTGKVLWTYHLGTAMQGVPIVYRAGGREYLVVCAAAPDVSGPLGRGRHRAPIHGSYVAFALPSPTAAH